ncbi:YqgE/AlgH family protein [Salinisphaera sp. USBA-960]|uniref:YqgE/AlgH family protein n=1 Tax=Salinisphaera orenii TaxID=856731 RepID=UPI000DBE3389|nr:YqgE/AlgH family protein [Salifodinibacter halophilus]NNC26465.1 YqgE/AlgH family protein [Salifodinibacter halophilus]
MGKGVFNNQFLLAMPGTVTGSFAESVIYITDHGDDGAMGLVINQLGELTIADVLDQLDLSAHLNGEQPVYWGGPVQPARGFVLHANEGSWAASMEINDAMALTTSRDILQAIGNGFGPSRYLMTFGYAGWGPGQLEEEMAANSWLSTPASEDIIFNTDPDARWNAAARQIGLDPRALLGDTGRA